VDELRYDGRVAIVTGGARGIGLAHVQLLAARGARVVVADLGGAVAGGGSDSQPADEVVAEIRAAGGEAIASYGDVADDEGAAAIVQAALDAFGRLDALVNNAGIHVAADFADQTPEQFERMLRVHVMGTVKVTQAAWPHLVASGSGRIVNTTSESILGFVDGSASYATAKGAVFALTRRLAVEGAPYGLHANAIAPRANTRMSEGNVERMRANPSTTAEQLEAYIDVMSPRHNAPAVGYLAHPSCELNGETLIVGTERVYRMAIVRSRGLHVPGGLTIEDIAGDVDSIMALDDATLLTSFNPSL
jgi:NAD(P)-dependent dehydrogenase (short-subunit alcohol dehydrogenase family)